MKTFFTLFFLFFFCPSSVPAQQVSLLWLYEIGGNGGTAVATNVTATNDSGFIILYGTLATTGPIDSLCSEPDPTNVFQKYNADASVLEWSQCYAANGDTSLIYMFPQNDGGIVFGGEYLGAGGFYVCKQDALGNIIWSHGYSENNGPPLRDMIATPDGGYLMLGIAYNSDTNFTIHGAGFEYADIAVMKLDSLGNKQWSKAIGGTNDEEAAKAIIIPGGGYYIAGSTRSNDYDCTGNHGGNSGSSDAYLARLDDTGRIIWHNDLGGTGEDGGGGQNSGYAMADGNGGIIMATVSGSEDGDVTHPLIGSSIWLIDIDSSNNIVWNNCYGGGGQEFPTSVCMAADGSIWIAGQSVVKGGEVDTSYGGSSDAWIVHADNLGNFINAKVLGSTGQDAGEMIYPLSNGSVMTGGYYENANGSFNIDWGAGGGGPLFLQFFRHGQRVLSK